MAIATALTCYSTYSPVAALAPIPTARAIALAMPMLVLNATSDHPELVPNQWDTDSKPVGHDTRASACISDCKDDFVPGTLKPCHRIVKTFGGRLSGGISIGTLRWNVLDSQGQHHTWLIPNSYCIPKAGLKLFSPQHWAQSIGGSANSNTNAKCTTMHWNNGASTLSLAHDSLSNVANFYLAPGYDDFLAFAQEAELTDDTKPVPLSDVPIVSDDDYSITSDANHPDTDQEDPWITDWHYELNQEEAPEDPMDSEGAKPRIFDLTPDDQMTSEHVLRNDEEEECMQHSNPAIELLRVHHQWNHMSFGKLEAMAKCGILPKRLVGVPTPVCAACLYGKATRKPWRDKPKLRDKHKLNKATRPGHIISVDMLVSPIPGLIAQMSGWITTKRYLYASVFVDHYSGFGYVHLQKTQSAEETLEGKEAFERRAATYGVTIQHYHADNGIFASKAWKASCANAKQGCTYSGVNAHFQSGVAERRIRELQELGRTNMIHGNSRWPEAINVHLWPYALKSSNVLYNEAPTRKMKRVPVELFSGAQVMTEPKFQRPIFSPCYVLDSALQNADGIKSK